MAKVSIEERFGSSFTVKTAISCPVSLSNLLMLCAMRRSQEGSMMFAKSFTGPLALGTSSSTSATAPNPVSQTSKNNIERSIVKIQRWVLSHSLTDSQNIALQALR